MECDLIRAIWLQRQNSAELIARLLDKEKARLNDVVLEPASLNSWSGGPLILDNASSLVVVEAAQERVSAIAFYSVGRNTPFLSQFYLLPSDTWL